MNRDCIMINLEQRDCKGLIELYCSKEDKREPIKFHFEKMKETGTTEVTGKDFKSEYIILKNKIKTKQCSIEFAQGYLYCLINMCVNDDNLYDEYSRAIDDIGER